MNADHFNTGASLRSRFLELENERKRSWAPEALAVNATQRATLVAGHGLRPHVSVGDILPPADLTTVEGRTITLDDLSAQGPAVVVFFRFAGCPACNIALPHYRDTLWPALQAAHIPLVAISPQPPALLGEIVTRHELPFPVATDSHLALSRALGLTYVFDAPSRHAAEAKGGTSQDLNGTESWELPKPAVLVIEPGRIVRFADISPDWMERTETPAILSALGLPVKESFHAA
ncbi:AhpC/TSA family protein [Komagataeibacter sp. AV436]|uniref:thioredoxin-dependent peroxiredoxin n=1 Tax=Komagataeibacter melomenusus TaxID=2766578 RepID=A0ABX2ABX0_9PROT|nr:peroxiredoxin-like family protein [Komagataeibacter melomenusus]MBV1829844.1 AhpC/TSA family protein [Komagataeibacter melomenusus]NPC65332.1 AhpC/TSA family protein [Komagataeibacter melomenusus]